MITQSTSTSKLQVVQYLSIYVVVGELKIFWRSHQWSAGKRLRGGASSVTLEALRALIGGRPIGRGLTDMVLEVGGATITVRPPKTSRRNQWKYFSSCCYIFALKQEKTEETKKEKLPKSSRSNWKSDFQLLIHSFTKLTETYKVNLFFHNVRAENQEILGEVWAIKVWDFCLKKYDQRIVDK